MAEVEEGLDIIKQAEEGIDEEGKATEGMDVKEKAEFEKQIKVAKVEVSKLSGNVQFFRNLLTRKSLKIIAKFVLKNTAIAAIFFGVEVLLTKLTKQTGNPDNKTNQKRLNMVKAIISLITTQNNMCNKIKEWLEKHKDDIINLDTVDVPVDDIFDKEMKSIANANEKAYNAAKPLISKTDSKVSFTIPTLGNIHHLLNASNSFVHAFWNLRDIAVREESKCKAITSLLSILTKETLDDIQRRIEDIMKMEF